MKVGHNSLKINQLDLGDMCRTCHLKRQWKKMLFSCSRNKLDINNREIFRKSLNIWKLTNTLLNNPSQKKKVMREIILNEMKMKNIDDMQLVL